MSPVVPSVEALGENNNPTATGGFSVSCPECDAGRVSWAKCAPRCDGSHIDCEDGDDLCVFCGGTGQVGA